MAAEATASADARPHVVVLVDYYLPGYKAGGPLRTLENIVAHLGDQVRFTILTRDRDLGDTAPYPGCGDVTRRTVGAAEVVYLSPAALSRGALGEEIRRARPDLVYLNSLFSPAFTLRTLLLRRAGRLPEVPFVLAPRGELSPGALALKRTKKRVFLAVARAIRLYDGVTWQASAEEEAREIRRWFGAGDRPVVVAPDLPPRVPHAAPPAREKRPGTLRAVFLSRISPKKNLDGALQLLAGIEGDIRFDVYGPEEDAAHVARCRALAEGLAPGVDVRFHGPIPPEQVPARLAEAHVFLFPTHGENFGHVILESLLAGCVPLLSDQTPWRGLAEAGAGWDLPLADAEAFRAALRRCVGMDDDEFRRRSIAARELGERFAADPAVVARTRRLFLDAAKRA